jgi:hypothetical protein
VEEIHGCLNGTNCLDLETPNEHSFGLHPCLKKRW